MKSPPLQRRAGAEGEPSESVRGAWHRQYLRNGGCHYRPQCNRHVSSSRQMPTDTHTETLSLPRDQWAGPLSTQAARTPGSSLPLSQHLTGIQVCHLKGFPWRVNRDHPPTPTTLRLQFHRPNSTSLTPRSSSLWKQLLKAGRRAPQGDGDGDRDRRCEGLGWCSQGGNRTRGHTLGVENLQGPPSSKAILGAACQRP